MGLAGLSLMSHKMPKKLQTYDKYPNLFKKKLFPLTSCSVSFNDVPQNDNETQKLDDECQY